MSGAHTATPSGLPRARALGIPLAGEPGPANAITDVPGVELGYATLIEGDAVRTGVTAIHPRGRAGAGDPWVAGVHVQNGNGEMTGLAWIGEAGSAAGPICLTNTHAVGIAHAGIVRWTVRAHPGLADAWLLPVASETWDGYLNDINGGHVTEAVVVAALDAARGGPVEEGSVGGGTGMNCYDFKGGSGTASRRVGEHTVGVFVQANFGDREELDDRRRPGRRGARGRQPDGRLLRAAGQRLDRGGRGDRRAAARAPVQRAGPAGDDRRRPHRHRRVALLRRPLPRALDRQPAARSRRTRRRSTARPATSRAPCASCPGARWTRTSRRSCRRPRRRSSTRSSPTRR